MSSEDYSGFNVDLLNAVRARAAALGDFTRHAFVDEVGNRLVEAEELQDFRVAFHEGTSGRRGITVDGWSDDDVDVDGSLTVLIAELYEGNEVTTIGSDRVARAFERAANFVQEAMDGPLAERIEPATPAADLAQRLAEGIGIRSVKVLLLTNAVTGARVRGEHRRTVKDIPVELHIWDLVRLHRLSGSGGREAVEIDLKEFTRDGLPALEAGLGASGYAAYLCAIPGALLADVYDRFGSRLLEGNVRSFLSAKGGVNKGIRKTIQDAPEKFFAYNNGVTATATAVEVERGGGITRLTRIRDLQIVNGGQTTASLHHAKVRDRSPLTNIFVQLKLSVLDDDVADRMIPEIARFANTQNKVSGADLFANHPFHRRLEEISRRIWAPRSGGRMHDTHWFYERARAQYTTEQARMTAARRREFLLQNPKDQVITKTDLAKYHNSWAVLPHMVSLGAQKNFAEFAKEVSRDFDKAPESFSDRWFQHLVAKALIFHATETAVSAAEWYGQAYRANIVTYAIAKMVHMVAECSPRRIVDLDAVWRAQEVSHAMLAQLDACAVAAQRVLLQPPTGMRNITEWAKKEACWVALRDARVPFHAAFEAELKLLVEERAETRDDRDIDAVTEVVRLAGAGFWQRAYLWPDTRRIVSPDTYRILEIAAQKRNRFVPISDLQARKLLQAWRALSREGLE